MKKFALGRIVGIVAVFWIATAVASQGQTFTTLFTFGYADGTGYGPIVQGTDGNFYGIGGGGKYGFGEVYEISPAGKLRTLYSFCAAPYACPDGESPNSLMQAANGNLYGTTQYGGAYGEGTIFQLTTGGDLTTLYSFCAENQANCPDGREPWGFAQGTNGKLYGTTSTGGIYDSGTIFEITPAGELTTLYSFCAKPSCTDGVGPGVLRLAPNGNLYGLTYASDCTGCGTLFEVTPAGKLKVLYTFSGVGTYPEGVLLGTDGNFYGTTYYTECCTLGGIVFKITPDGTETTLYTFCSQTNCTDGELPLGGLTEGTDGNFYGTTVFGGIDNCSSFPFKGCGAIYKITPGGDLTTLYSFCPQTNCPDGSFPNAPPMLATNGTFYGTATAGGDQLQACYFTGGGCGTIYTLDMGFGSFVESNPTFGKVGYTINILGNNLTGTTSVTFNGTSAAFTVVSDTYIKATVPTGTTSGTIEVTTPSGTLSSNVPFRILP
jgi:uncharacterized repeat protein (TIGR03803 family)